MAATSRLAVSGRGRSALVETGVETIKARCTRRRIHLLVPPYVSILCRYKFSLLLCRLDAESSESTVSVNPHRHSTRSSDVGEGEMTGLVDVCVMELHVTFSPNCSCLTGNRGD